VGYGKIKIEGQWRWDEEEEKLKDDKGNRRKERQGEEKKWPRKQAD